MIYPKTKLEITETVLSELSDSKDNIWKELPVDDVVFRWWQTGRQGTGLRLSDEGMRAFSLAEIAFYEFELGDIRQLRDEWTGFLLKLSKKLASPYYLGVKKNKDMNNINGPFLRIYDHKIAMMLTLYGTLQDYLEALK